MRIVLDSVCWPRKLHLSVRHAACHSERSEAANAADEVREARLSISDHFFGRDGMPNIQRCFASLNMTSHEQHQQSSTKCFSPFRRRTSDSVASIPSDEAWCCSHVCWCRRVSEVAGIFWSAEEVDSTSGQASYSIRFAKAVGRQRRCKSVRTSVLLGLTKERARTRYRPDVLD